MEKPDKKKILIIEDEREMLAGLSTFLKSSGYSTIAAYDATFGIDVAHKESPDLIILDLGLPAGGGIFVFKSLKNSISTSDIPVVILTAQQEPDLKDRMKAAGAAEYFQKPFDPPSLLGCIKGILKD